MYFSYLCLNHKQHFVNKITFYFPIFPISIWRSEVNSNIIDEQIICWRVSPSREQLCLYIWFDQGLSFFQFFLLHWHQLISDPREDKCVIAMKEYTIYNIASLLEGMRLVCHYPRQSHNHPFSYWFSLIYEFEGYQVYHLAYLWKCFPGQVFFLQLVLLLQALS